MFGTPRSLDLFAGQADRKEFSEIIGFLTHLDVPQILPGKPVPRRSPEDCASKISHLTPVRHHSISIATWTISQAQTNSGIIAAAAELWSSAVL